MPYYGVLLTIFVDADKVGLRSGTCDSNVHNLKGMSAS